MQVSVTSPEQETARGGGGGGGYLVSGGEQHHHHHQQLAQAVPITIRSIDPNIQHQQVYTIQPIQVSTQPQFQVHQDPVPTAPVRRAAAAVVAATPKMKGKKGNKKNVWVPGKPLTPKAREMMESGKGSMNQDGRWTCIECNRSLSNEWTLEQHIQTVHGERIFNCKSCNKKFKRRDHLLNHIKTIHKGLKPCKKCNVVFINKEELRAHKMAVHLKITPEDTAPPPLAKNTAQDVHQYLDDPSPPVTPMAMVQAAAPVQAMARSNNVVATYDNLMDGFSIPSHGTHQVVVTINPQPAAQGQAAGITYQHQPISVVPVAVSHSALPQQVQAIGQVQPSYVIPAAAAPVTHSAAAAALHPPPPMAGAATATAVSVADLNSSAGAKPTVAYRYILS